MIRLFLLGALLWLPGVALAQSEFSISVFGSEDTVPPSVPILTSATPLTSDQIDVVWSSSTDNYLVFGYVVYRDGIAIATTTLTNFSDSGLAASTTYTYNIQAFDGVPNYSASSTALATTTLAVPPEPVVATTTLGNQGTAVRTVLGRVVVSAGVATATIDVTTQRPSRIEVRIGETDSYELAQYVGEVYRAGHIIPISDLRPGTTYYYEIIGYSPRGIQTSLERGSFTTIDARAPSTPQNVRNFSTFVVGNDVSLDWQLPLGISPNARVRIVRNHFTFPQYLNDGVVVYEGRADQVLDRLALLQKDIVYYTAFVIDPQGLVSSGAIATARRSISTDVDGQESTGDPSGQETPITEEPVLPNPDMPNARDIQLWQAELVQVFADRTISLDSNVPFRVSIPAVAIKGPFKTITATMSDPTDPQKEFSFLLRLNSDKTAYTATIAPVQLPGVSRMTVSIYDFNTRVIGVYTTDVTFYAAPDIGTSTLSVFMLRLSTWLWSSLLLVPFVVMVWLWLVFRKRGEDNE